MIEVAPGIRQLTNGISNWYLVDEGGSVTLVDAGKPADWAQLLSALRTLGRTLDAVDNVLLTHAHSDHTGFAERARAEAGATARVHVADAAAASGEGRWENIGESWRMADVLGSKGIPNRVDAWGPDYDHDWPTWRRMLPQYLAELTGG